MARTISRIEVTGPQTVQIFFADGTRGSWCKIAITGKWTAIDISEDELASARSLARNATTGKWRSWHNEQHARIARELNQIAPHRNSREDAREDLDALEKFNAKRNAKPDGFIFGDSQEG